MPVESTIDVCPESAVLDALLAGNLPVGDHARVLAHIGECDHCRGLLRSQKPSGVAPAPLAACPHSDTVTGEEVHDGRSTRNTDVDISEVAKAIQAVPTGREAADWHGLFSPPQAPDELGRLGGYRILKVLGEGGMGVVFAAEDAALKRRVAIKILRPGLIEPSQRQRFLQEAQLAASLSSDHIVTVYQVAEASGCLFIVMELLTGETLEDRLARERSLPLADALRIAREVAEGLSAAHAEHLVHRDIKPANVWLEARRLDEPAGRVKLLDFGVARSIADTQHLTIGGHIVGTPSYMSPEQACGAAVDQRSDLFSLGGLLYAMLAGQPPFDRGNFVQTLKAVVDEPAEPLTKRLPGLPPQVGRLVERLLAKQIEDRPNSARQVAHEIRKLEQNMTITGLLLPHSQNADKAPAARIYQRLGWGGWAGVLAIVLAMALGTLSQYHRLAELLTATASSGEMPAATAQAPNSASVASSVVAIEVPDKPPAKESTPPASEDPAALPPDTKPAAAAAGVELPPIKVGIVHSLTGPMAVSERPIVDALMLAINEINESGGLLGGRSIEAIVRDGKSNEHVFATQAQDLIAREHVVTLFGCWRSPCRKLVEEVCRRHEHLLIFPATYEGLEDSPYVIYAGGAPNQQILPAVKWAFAFLNKRKFYLVGVDGIYSHSAHAIIGDELRSLGGEVVGVGYRPLGDTAFAEIAQQVVDAGADVVLNTVSGTGNISLFHCLREAGIKTDSTPVISFKVSEEELQSISGYDDELAGDYAVWSYFQSLSNQDNDDFIARLRQRYGPTRMASDTMEVAYSSVYLWARGVEYCQSDNVDEIRAGILTQTLEAPEGNYEIDSDNRHAWRRAIIGQVNQNLQYDIIWSSPKAIAPVPFPASRTRAAWEKFQHDLYVEWGSNWRSQPGRARPTTSTTVGGETP